MYSRLLLSKALSIVISISILFLIPRTAGLAQEESVIRVVPSAHIVRMGTIFSVNVKFENIPALGADNYAFILGWNASILQCLDVTEVGLTAVTPLDHRDNVFRNWFSMSNSNIACGYAWQDLAAAYADGYAPIKGSGTLATIAFNATGVGYTDLTITFAILLNCGGCPGNAYMLRRSVVNSGVSSRAETSEPSTIIVPDDYSTIQAAINATSGYDIICVRNGTYNENLHIERPLTLVGESVAGATIDGWLVTDYTHNVNINNFTIKNGGIALESSWDCGIIGNNVINSMTGVGIYGGSGNKIQNNTIADSVFEGLFLGTTFNNFVSENSFINNGIVSFSDNNVVINNSVNGKPLVYLNDVSDQVVDDAGQVVLVNCDNITVNNLDLSSASVGVDLYCTTNSRITNNTISNNYHAIQLDSSSSNTISGNKIINSRDRAVYLEFLSCNNTISSNEITSNSVGIRLQDSNCNNVLSNQISDNWNGVELYLSNLNVISGNTMIDDLTSVWLWSSSGNLFFHNNFLGNWSQVYDASGDIPEWRIPPSTNVWDNGYSSGGNCWSSYNGTDSYSGPYQNLTGSDGIGDTPCIIDSNNRDNYPLIEPYTGPIESVQRTFLTIMAPAHGTINPGPQTYMHLQGRNVTVQASPDPCYIFDHWELDGLSVGSTNPYVISMDSDHTINAVFGMHDITIDGVFSPKTLVGQGYSVNLTVSAANLGDYQETFNLTLYANSTYVVCQNLTLAGSSNSEIDIIFDTTSLQYGTYVINAYAWPVQSEANTADNDCTGPSITVTIPGDVNGDGKIDIYDVILVAKAFGSHSGEPDYNAAADLTNYGVIGITDAIIVAAHFGQHWI